MKTRILFNLLSVLGLIATFATCYYYYDYNRKEGLSSVIVWGTAPIMIFVVVSSVLQLRKSFRKGKR